MLIFPVKIRDSLPTDHPEMPAQMPPETKKKDRENPVSRIPAPPMDQFNYALSGLGDQSIRMVVSFGGTVDAARLGAALGEVMREAPVLNSRFVEGNTPCWEGLPGRVPASFISIVPSSGSDHDLGRLLAVPVDSAAGPQIRVTILRGIGGDTLCITVHHAVMDAHGLFSCTRALAEYYRCPERRDAPLNATSDRSLEKVLASVQAGGIPKTHMDLHPPPTGWAFPCSQSANLTRSFAIRTLPASYLAAVKQKGKEKGATVNDVLLSAYFLALFATIQPDGGQPLPVMVSLDLRRYRDKAQPASLSEDLSNQSVAFPVMVAPDGICSLEAMMERVQNEMNYRKAHNPGIDSALDLDAFGYADFMGIQERVRAMKQEYLQYRANPPFLANIGVIPDKTVDFSPDLPVLGAYIAGIVIDPPGITLGVTTFKDRLTLAMGYGSPAISRESMERFMDLLVGYLPAP